MKTIHAIAMLLLLPFLGMSQSIEKFSVDSGGASVLVGNTAVLYTIGEVHVQELSASDIQVSEGFINAGSCVGEVTALTQPKTVNLDAMGNASLLPEDVDNGSINTCGDVFLAFETTSYAQETTTSSPTDEFVPDSAFYVATAAFTVPVAGDYRFSMTNNSSIGSVLLIWDDTPVPNSGLFSDRPEYLGFGFWQSDGTFGNSAGAFVGDTVSLEANKTYYMSSLMENPGETGTFTTTIDMPIRTTAATREYGCKDIGVVEETLYAFDAAANTGSETAAVTVNGVLTTYTGGSWDNGAPTMGSRAVINDALVTSGTSIEACACDVNAALTIESGDYLRVAGAITVAASGVLLVANGGSVVQVNDAATVTNDGSITVAKITPSMAAQSFMISGSPMTGETREGVFGSAYIVRNHDTSNFVPNAAVAAQFPSANNFADDNGDNWITHTGGLSPGEGYLVFPQPDGTSSGSYTQNHTLGTLNNGVVEFTTGFNGTQNASPSMMSNPYASAIDAEVFFDDPANSGIDVVYFWEHNTPLSLSYPGYNAANFSMADISMYQEGVGGNPAASGGNTPTQFISSGQGFAVKPTAGGVARFNNAMRVTGPNDSYRSSSDAIVRDRLWLKVHNEPYGLGSTTLLAFTENTSDAYVPTEDVKRIATPVSLYCELDTDEELGINALGAFETSDAVYLSFSTQVKEIQSYRISIHALDGEQMLGATVYLIDALTGSVSNLSQGDYTFQSGEATYSKRFKVVFENGALGTNDATLQAVSLYPNPTQNTVTIVSPQTAVKSATVYDLRGRKVSEVDFSNTTSYQVDLSNLEAAVYFVNILTDNGVVNKRVIKNN